MNRNTPPGFYGLAAGPGYQGQPRSVIGAVETSNAGNVIVRVGRANTSGTTWSQTEHVVLDVDEARALQADLAAALAARTARPEITLTSLSLSEQPECQGHPDDGEFNGPIGETVYCDGSCEAGR